MIRQKLVTGSSNATGKKPSLILFGGLAIIALLKDLLDLVGLGSLPVIGTAVTLCFSFTIFMLLLVFDQSGGRGNKRMAQGLVMTVTTLIEGIGFIINFLPIQTLNIFFLYAISYRAWKIAQQTEVARSRRQMRKFQSQQVQVARAIARQEDNLSARVQMMTGPEEIKSNPPAVGRGSVRVPQPGRITVRRGRVVDSAPLVRSTRPTVRPSVPSRRSTGLQPGSPQPVGRVLLNHSDDRKNNPYSRTVSSQAVGTGLLRP
ncbi:MAG: hypothetical protein E6Q06_03305 [Candidatus Moraniibacteriota bacterium]|nr:MAG: hypothetical protein E6Q06_03305 [Candidatus Moranbacteria bacterium]